MKKICILINGKHSFWKEFGEMIYSKDVNKLAELIKDKDFEIKFGTSHNDFSYNWSDIK